MAIGSRRPDHAKVELLNLNTFRWSEGPTYPYHNAINYAPVVFYEGGFLVFGGFTDSEQVKTIARDDKLLLQLHTFKCHVNLFLNLKVTVCD